MLVLELLYKGQCRPRPRSQEAGSGLAFPCNVACVRARVCVHVCMWGGASVGNSRWTLVVSLSPEKRLLLARVSFLESTAHKHILFTNQNYTLGTFLNKVSLLGGIIYIQ